MDHSGTCGAISAGRMVIEVPIREQHLVTFGLAEAGDLEIEVPDRPTPHCGWCEVPLTQSWAFGGVGRRRLHCRRCSDLLTEVATFSLPTQRSVAAMIDRVRRGGGDGPEIRRAVVRHLRGLRPIEDGRSGDE